MMKLLYVWRKVEVSWGKWLRGLWVAWGVHVVCGVFWLLGEIPTWGYVLSMIPWLFILAINLTFNWIAKQLLEQYDKP